MADTRTIYLHTGTEIFSSDPTDTQYKYLDMSDYDSLNPEYQSTIRLSNGVAGIYEDAKAKITLTFKGANSGRDERAEWVNKYAEKINKISVSSTNNKGQVFNKSATVSYVEFIDTPYIDGVQVQIEVTMFGRWQSALSIIETVTEKYEGGSKAYLGTYYSSDNGMISGNKNYIVNGNFIRGSQGWGGGFSLESDGDINFIRTTAQGQSNQIYQENIGVKTGDTVTISFYARSDKKTQVVHSEMFGDSGANFSVSDDWKRMSYTTKVGAYPSLYIYAVTEGQLDITMVQVEKGSEATIWKPNYDQLANALPHYNYDYRYGKTTLLNQISLPKDRNRFMLAIDSNYTVATITLSAGGKRATISTSRLNTNSSISSDFVAYDITEFVDTDKFLLLTSGLVASVVWDNLASQYAVLYNIMNSVGDTPADISVTTTGGQHIPFKLYTYSVQDFI